MRPRSNWNRRTFLGSVAALAGSLAAPKKLFASARSASRAVSGFGQSGNPYEELGVTTVINCEGTMTMLGGSLPHPELEAVMMQAGRHFVSIPELEAAAGNKIAEMLKLPEGYTALVTSGAAAAMQSGLAGILTGSNEAYIKQLPDLTGLKSEVIIQKSHRNPFDHQLRSTGVRLIEIETRDDLQKAVNERTAMMHFTNFANGVGQIKVDEWPKLAKQYNLPCMNDAAADTPPVSHLWDYANMGYDLITFSGGKAIRGPRRYLICGITPTWVTTSSHSAAARQFVARNAPGCSSGVRIWSQMPCSTTARTRTRSAAVKKSAKKKLSE